MYSKLIFSQQGNAWNDIKWTTHWGVIVVTMWDKEHLFKNISYAIIREMVVMEPMQYCAMTKHMSNFQED